MDIFEFDSAGILFFCFVSHNKAKKSVPTVLVGIYFFLRRHSADVQIKPK